MNETDWTLSELREHWGDAYVIWRSAPGRWEAERRDGKGTVRADSPNLLAEMIRADYGAQPVPRQ